MPCMLILNMYSLLANSVPGQNGTDIYLVLCVVFERLFIQHNSTRMVRSTARAADCLSTHPLSRFLNRGDAARSTMMLNEPFCQSTDGSLAEALSTGKTNP